MKTPVVVPPVGESITRGFLAHWLKQEGESVRAGEDLFELETEKATVSVPAPADGSLSITVPDGSDVEIGREVGSIESEKPKAGAAPAQPEKKPPAAEPKPPAPKPAPEAKPPAEKKTEPPLSPAVRRILAEKNLDAAGIAGTGKGGRILKEDALKARAPAATPGAEPGEGEEEGLVTRAPLSEIRKTIARRVVAAHVEAALLTTFNEIDMSSVVEARAAHGEKFLKRYGVKLGFMSFFIRAAAAALAEFPVVNSRIEGTDVVTPGFIDIGVAVATERGLLVPVLRNADRLRFDEIETKLADLAARARGKKISLAELQGGTFTITNGGVFGSLMSTPLPNYPQSAILGMHAMQKRPVVVDDAIVVRPMMYVALTYDHRLIDGRDAVLFLSRVKRLVEDPEALLLGD